jgi:hypothetical protein
MDHYILVFGRVPTLVWSLVLRVQFHSLVGGVRSRVSNLICLLVLRAPFQSFGWRCSSMSVLLDAQTRIFLASKPSTLGYGNVCFLFCVVYFHRANFPLFVFIGKGIGDPRGWGFLVVWFSGQRWTLHGMNSRELSSCHEKISQENFSMLQQLLVKLGNLNMHWYP